MEKQRTILMNQLLQPRLIEFGVAKNDKKWNYKGIRSTFHRIYYIEKGEIYVDSASHNYKLSQGKFYFIRGNTTMDYYAKDQFIQHFIHVQLPLLGSGDYLENIDEFIEFDMPEADIEQMKQFASNTDKDYIWDITLIYHLIKSIIVNAKEYECKNILKDVTYIKLIDYINYNLNFNMSVQMMAEYCGQSVSDFTRKFKGSVGMTPKVYLHNLIFDRVSQLLLTSDYSIKEISQLVGMNDSMYFSRFFKKKCGMSPKAYRESRYL